MTIKATKRSGEVHRVSSEFFLRLYTARQAKSLLSKVKNDFELVGVFDFDYDIEEPREFDDDLTDALFVLKKIFHCRREDNVARKAADLFFQAIVAFIVFFQHCTISLS